MALQLAAEEHGISEEVDIITYSPDVTGSGDLERPRNR